MLIRVSLFVLVYSLLCVFVPFHLVVTSLSINQSLFANAITSKQQKSVTGCQNRQ